MTMGKPSTTAHVREVGPRMVGVNHGTPAPEGAFVPAKAIEFGSDGSVSYKHNIQTARGGEFSTAESPHATTVGKYLESW